MYKFFFVFVFFTALYIKPTYSNNDTLNISASTTITSKSVLGFNNNLKSGNKRNANLNLGYSKYDLTSQLSVNYNEHNKFNFDDSYANYRMGIANFNIGKIERNWSFSEKSSLILSSNARPFTAFSLSLKNNFKFDWLPSTASWSIEVINGSTKNTYNNKNSMLFGARTIINPTDKLSFEILQTSQWGGEGRELDGSLIRGILFGDTNSGINAEINKMAGFGLSYLIPINESIVRIYGQAIGEDEAGSLPSCYSWMAGFELSTPKIKVPTTLTFELIDTRVDMSTNGYCGPNTMYNNAYYKYTNYNTVLGVPIDTESTSLELFGQSKLNRNLTINYSTRLVTINDNSYSSHRLSTKRSTGSITSLGLSWEKGMFDVGGNISYQNLYLDKSDISNGTQFGLFTSVKF
ncbi:capsule assembly Wzi family protein [Amylibacter sp.]|nr:capsule assembly Wzi family protein [Amylibacter sp.]